MHKIFLLIAFFSNSAFAQIDEKVFPFYAEIDCQGFQVHACIDSLTLRNGDYFKDYKISDLWALAGTNDGQVRLSADLREIDIHLKLNNSLIVQNRTVHPPLSVKISDRADNVIFEKITTRKYEVIKFSN